MTMSTEELMHMLTPGARALMTHLPDYMWPGLLEYLYYGVPTGGFLEAVISNDLKEACGRADVANRRALWDYVNLFHSHWPMAAWGSPERYAFWVKRGGMTGKPGS